MRGGDGFQAVPEDLHAHATTVQAVADEVETAAQAAQAVHFDANAYGTFCQVLPAMMEPLKEIICQALSAATAGLHDSGQKLRTAAANYQGSDSATARRFGLPS